MPKAAKALLTQRAPKRPKNDAFEQANSMAERYNGMTRLETDAYGDRHGGRGEPLRDRDFPVQLNKPNKQSTRLQNKAEYVANRGNGGPNFGEIRATEADIEVLQEIEKRKQEVSFESWLANYFDMNDPATAKLVEDMMPEYYEKRMEAIEHQAELQKNLALIRLRGPKNKQDLMVLYLAATGKLPVPSGGVHQPDKWSSDGANLVRGIWSPRRFRPPILRLDKNDPIGTVLAFQAGGPANVLPDIGGLRGADQAGPRRLPVVGNAFGV
jgi:hypothetical protein